jgi:transcriptional regulator with XRE-family HTH domain
VPPAEWRILLVQPEEVAMSAIGEDIRKRRKDKGLTQSKLARDAELDQARLSEAVRNEDVAKAVNLL